MQRRVKAANEVEAAKLLTDNVTWGTCWVNAEGMRVDPAKVTAVFSEDGSGFSVDESGKRVFRPEPWSFR